MSGDFVGKAEDGGDRLEASAYRPMTRWSWWLAGLLVIAALVVATLFAQGAIVLMDAAGITAGYWQLPVALAFSQLICIAITLWAAGLLGGRREYVLGLGPPHPGAKSYLYAYLAMVLIFGSLSALLWVWQPDSIAGDLSFFAALLKSPSWWLAVLVIVIGAPIMEELMFRGFLFSALARSKLGIGGATVVTSAAWTALHAGYSVAGLLEVFLVGLYFAWLLVKTGSLRVPIFCHAAYNLSALVLILVVDIPVAAPG